MLTGKLSNFHVLTGYSPDLLHDLFEGIVPLEIALSLKVFIQKKYLTLSEVNDSVKHFPFKWSNKTKSSTSHICHSEEHWGKLSLKLGYVFLPFLIRMKVPADEAAWQLLMDLKEIV